MENIISNDVVLNEDIDFLSCLDIDFYAFKDKAVFVTGATGLIGSYFVKAISYCNKKYDLNMKIYALVRDLRKVKTVYAGCTERDDIEFIKGDVTQCYKEYINNKKIDIVLHAASITTSKTMIELPVETINTAINGTQNMLEMAKDKNVSEFIYISSMEVYGSFYNGEYVNENDMGYINPLVIRSNYCLAKRMCENMCMAYFLEYNVPIKIARLSQTFGAGILPGENRVFAQFAKSVINNTDIVLHTKGLSEGNYCYTSDMVAGILYIILEGNYGEAYNISNEESHTTIADMANMVAEKIASGNINVIFDIPDDNKYGYASDTKMKLNSSKLRSLGWKPSVSLEDAYKRLIKSMKSEN